MPVVLFVGSLPCALRSLALELPAVPVLVSGLLVLHAVAAPISETMAQADAKRCRDDTDAVSHETHVDTGGTGLNRGLLWFAPWHRRPRP